MFAASSFNSEFLESGVLVTARLNVQLQAIDRQDIYEDPLDAMLKAEDLGEVVESVPRETSDGDVRYCDLTLRLPIADGPTLAKVCDVFELLGAPKGSQLMVKGSKSALPFGKLEGLAVYLNGTDLEAEVYKSCDINHVISAFDRLMGRAGRYQGFWQGPKETALYLYGKSATAMQERIKPFLATYPLCQQARIAQIA